MSDELLTFNGVDGSTGRYLLPPMSPEQISKVATGESPDPGHLSELRYRYRGATEAFFGPKEGVDPKDLAQAGWGVIFAHDADPEIRQALGPLLDHRRAQAGRVHEHYYREFARDRGYRPGESKPAFLARHGAGPIPANPEKVPYYLLIVGSPESIPYTFQYQLDVAYAVGRIHFDRLEDYANYANSVVAAETGGVRRPRRVTFFAPRNPGDQATALSAAELVTPLVEQLSQARTDWEIQGLIGETATKARLAELFARSNPAPALLFTATHGVGFDNGHPDQLRRQGALLCQEWPGPGRPGRLDEAAYFSSDDSAADAQVGGLISFHFACFGAGTPAWDDFAHRYANARWQLAPYAFVAALPRRLLSHPNGGALAVIGHVDRAWSYSFVWPKAGRQTEVYAGCLTRLVDGHPIGSAFEYFNQCYAALASDLNTILLEINHGKRPKHRALAAMWTANNDARNFVILAIPRYAWSPRRQPIPRSRGTEHSAGGNMMNGTVKYADLEIGLHQRTPRSCSVELRFNHPESAADEVFPTGNSRLRFDLGKLREQVLNPAAYGRVLSKSLFVPEVKQAFDTARTLAQSDDLPLRIRLRIGPSVPELHGVWWETLRDPKDDSPLLMDQSILFSRFLSSLDPRPIVVGSKSALRALVAIANPSNLTEYEADGRPLPPIDVEGELERAKRALGRIPITELASGGTATLDRVVEELRKGHDILYLVCHGYFVEGESLVLLEDSNGMVDWVSGFDFVDALRDLQRPPRLVVLASCQSAGPGEVASSDEHGALAALGPRMAEAGVPAVLAMQGRVSMQTIERFIPVFFEQLDRDGQIDRAMTLARAAVRHRHDWWVPVLFMRLKTGRFWYEPGFVGGRDVPRLAGLCNEIRQGRCTALLGPGLTETRFMSRQEIARGWAGQYHYPMAPHHRDDLPHVAQYLAVEQSPNLPRDDLLRYLRKELLERYRTVLPEGAEQGSLDELITAVGAYYRLVDPFEPHAVLARLPFKIFITIDPTDLLTDALKAEEKDPQIELCRWNEEANWPESVFDDPASPYEPTTQRPLVYHLFGRLRIPETLVLTEDNYFDYLIGVTRNQELIPGIVRCAFTNSSLLFLGFRLDEWDFRVLFRSIMSQPGHWLNKKYPHVAAQINPDEGRALHPDRARRYLESYFLQLDPIQVSIFWGSVEDFVRRLSDYWHENIQ